MAGRRDFLVQGTAGLVGFSALGSFGQKTSPPASKPNLLIIHTDQQSSWSLSCYAREMRSTPNYGKVLVETPHIDRLAREGVRLTNFFTNSAVCTPSRGCLFTGRYPHSHGAYRNNIPLNRDETTTARVLTAHGYETGYCGKWHLDGPPKPGFMTSDRAMGFEDCRFMFNRGHWKQMTDLPNGTAKAEPDGVIGPGSSYTTDWLTDKAIGFATASREKPFFYVVSYPDPHTPFTVREPYMSMYRPEDMPVPKTFVEVAGRGNRRRTAAWLKVQKARYCGLVKCIDDNVGRILRALEAKGILDTTVIVFTTDHGEYMGEHGLYGKNQWYRTAYRVPFIIRWPGRVRPNVAIKQFCSTVDVQPTLLSLMGVPVSGREQGRSFAGLLGGSQHAWTDQAMIHHSSQQSAGIFTRTHELVLMANGEHLLFDRERDPEQTRNLARNPEHRVVFDRLKAKIRQHHRDVASPATEWLDDLDRVSRPQKVGIVYSKTGLSGDTMDDPGASFTRIITTPPGVFRAGCEYRISFRFESGGLGGRDSAFYYTLRPGNDRGRQTGPLRWRSEAGVTGTKEHILRTAESGNFALIIGIYRQGSLKVIDLCVERVK